MTEKTRTRLAAIQERLITATEQSVSGMAGVQSLAFLTFAIEMDNIARALLVSKAKGVWKDQRTIR